MPNFNFPDKNDPDFADKMVNLVKELFEKNDSGIKSNPPITVPTEGLQIGSMYFDKNEEKIKVNTSSGIKTLKYE